MTKTFETIAALEAVITQQAADYVALKDRYNALVIDNERQIRFRRVATHKVEELGSLLTVAEADVAALKAAHKRQTADFACFVEVTLGLAAEETR